MVGYDSRKLAQNRTDVKRDFGIPFCTIFQTQDRKEPQPIGGGPGLSKFAESLYIRLTIGQAPKGEGEKNYLVCYPTLEKKETSCKEIT
jgi:hypothetical protein